MASIQGIYIALFGRPADPDGLAYWTENTKGGQDLSFLVGRLTDSAEYMDLAKEMAAEDLINSIYQKLFDRDADPIGLTYFLDKLASGEMTIETIAIDILNGATGPDLARINAKIEAADLFTAGLDLDEEVEAYSGRTAEQVGRDFIDAVDENNPADQAAADAAILKLLDAPSEGGPSNGGGGGGGGGGGRDFDAIGKLTVAGDVEEGGTVTASLTAKDPNGAVTYSDFTWQYFDGADWVDADGVIGDVDGPDNSVFVIYDEQSVVGKQLRAVATTTDVKGGTTDFASAVAAIANVNDVPEIDVGAAVTVDEDDNVVVDLLGYASDEDGDALTIDGTPSAENGTIVLVGEDWVYTPNPDYNGDDTITFSVTDENSAPVFGSVAVTVNSVNDAPVITVESVNTTLVAENNARTLIAELSISDVDNDLADISLTVDNDNFEISDGKLYLKADRDFEALEDPSLNVTVTASDLEDAATQSFTVTITDVVTVYSLAPSPATVIGAFDITEDKLQIVDGDVTASVSGPLSAGSFASLEAAPLPSGGITQTAAMGTFDLTASTTDTIAVVELTNNFSTDFAGSVDATDLFGALRNDYSSFANREIANIGVGEAGWTGYLVAYADSNAYLFYAKDSNNNGLLTKNEVSLAATVTGVAAGDFSFDHFIGA